MPPARVHCISSEVVHFECDHWPVETAASSFVEYMKLISGRAREGEAGSYQR